MRARHTGRTPWDDSSRDWRDVTTSQGKPGIDGRTEGRKRQRRILLKVPERA